MVFVESVNHIAKEANELNVNKVFVTFWEGLDQTKKEGGLVDEFYVSISRKNNEAKFQPIPYCEIVLAQRSTWAQRNLCESISSPSRSFSRVMIQLLKRCSIFETKH